MSTILQRLIVSDPGGSRVRIVEEPVGASLAPQEADVLVARAASQATAGGGVEHCEPLALGRWAVGRAVHSARTGHLFVWRILPSAAVEAIGGHPAWLLTVDAWFDPANPAGLDAGLPIAQPLRQLLQLAAPALGRNGQATATVAGVIEALRAGGARSAKPTALVVQRATLDPSDRRARWLALALLSAMPPSVGHPLRVHLGGFVQPGDADLALVPEAPRGFVVIHPTQPPSGGSDVVGYFIRNRLDHGDPEAVEAAAWLYDRGNDGWVEGIVALIRDGLAGSPDVLRGVAASSHPDSGASTTLAERLAGGENLTPAVVRELVEACKTTGDAEPWRAIRRHPAVQRSGAVKAVLAEAQQVRPTAELIEELCGVYPRGAPLEAWLPTLMRWLEQGQAPVAVASAIQTTLLEWPEPAILPLRRQVWTSVVRTLSRLGHGERAAEALVRSPVAKEMVGAGEGAALVKAWPSLPAEHRTEGLVSAMVTLLGESSDGPRLVVALLEQLRDDPDLAAALIHGWVRATAGTADARDPVLEAVRRNQQLQVWAEAITHLPDAAAAQQALRSWAPKPSDPLRALTGRGSSTPPPVRGRTPRTALRTPPPTARRPEGPRRSSQAPATPRSHGAPPSRSSAPATPRSAAPPPVRSSQAPAPIRRSEPPRDRRAAGGTPVPARRASGPGFTGDPREAFLDLGHQDVAGRNVEDRMLQVAEGALAKSRFPDTDISQVCAALAGQAETNRVWGWVALASGAPGKWDDETVDATVYAFLFEPPTDDTGQRIALQAARSLGEARRWEPLDHARWLVRLALAPTGPLNQRLAHALLEGIGRRTDGAPFLADMILAMLELPPDHPAVGWLLELLVPSGWRGDRLARVLKSIPQERVPRILRDAWTALEAAARPR